MAVWSMKIDQERYDAFSLLAETQGTTKNALMVEAVDMMLAGGMQKVLDERLDACLMRYFCGAPLDEVVDSRLRPLINDIVTDILNEKPKTHPGMISPNSNQEVDIKEVLTILGELLQKSDVALDDLATTTGFQDKGLLSRALSGLGIKTERKRVAGGQRKQMYEQGMIEQVRKAIIKG